MDKRAFIENWFTTVWVNENMGAIGQMSEPDVKARGLTDKKLITQDEFRVFVQALLGLCSFDSVSIDNFIEDGEWTHVLVTLNGKARKTGDQITFDAQVLSKIKDGKFLDAYNHIDYISLFQQLGMLPEDTIGQCLSGCTPK